MRIDIIQPAEMPKVPKIGAQRQAEQIGADRSSSGGGKPKSDGGETGGAGDGSRTAEEVRKVINEMIDSVLDDRTSLQFKMNDKTHRIVIQVINDKTREVVRQIPPEKIVETMASICKLVGVNVDEKV